ncbi:MAG: hypothetical protein RQ750_03510 [Roseovarius sp.]|nr:hypothetical protein [Roseovarius sp.]
MNRGNMPSAPNYTNAALAMGLVNLIWVFMVIWAKLGLLAVIATGYLLDKMISRIARRR